MPSSRGSRKYCFTLNNYSEEDIKFLSTPSDQISYLCYGKEVGEQGTPHLQGFVVFYNSKTLITLKKMFGDKYHFEACKGTVEQNIAYCGKEERFIEYGVRPKQQGKRTDIESVRERVRLGVPINQVVWESTSYQSARHAELLYKHSPRPEEQKRKVLWFYGKSGTGKTRMAVTDYPDYWISGRNLKWWDGYTGQYCVIIDDFRSDFCTFHELIRILDRYPYRVEVKGASMWIQPSTKVIVITSPYHPSKVYETIEDKSQLLRRIDEIRCF